MRILVWSDFLRNPQSAVRHWLVRGMEAAGHQVIAVDPYVLAAVFGVVGMQRLLLTYAQAYKVNVALVLPGGYVEPWFCRALQERGVAIVSFRYDDSAIFAEPVAWPDDVGLNYTLDRHADAVVAFNHNSITGFQAYGYEPPHYLKLPFAAETIPVASGPKRPVIAYCGAPKGRGSWRVRMVTALAQAGIPLELHHDGWAAFPEFASFARPSPDLAAYFEISGSALASLCLFANNRPVPDPAMKALPLEIAAAGGLPLANPCPELGEYLRPGDEVLVFDNESQLQEAARSVLASPDRAATMATRARAAVLGGYTWKQWWQDVAAILRDKGIDLPLEAEPIEPDPAFGQVLSMATLAAGHVKEAAGELNQARGYFEETLRYAPDDYAALAGLARLAGETTEALGLWQRVASQAELAGAVPLGQPLRLQGVGAQSGVGLHCEALMRRFQIATALGDDAGQVSALAGMGRLQPEAVVKVLHDWIDKGRLEGALHLVNGLLQHFPARGSLWQLRGELRQRSGDPGGQRDLERAAYLTATHGSRLQIPGLTP